MTLPTTPRAPEPPECDATFDRLPWLVNGTLAAPEAHAVETHVAACPRCASRLERERELLRSIRRPVSRVERAPLAAWAQFERALEAADAASTPGAAPAADASRPAIGAVAPATPAPAAANGAPRAARWRGLRLALAAQAAAIVVLAITLAWVLVSRTPGGDAAAWRTVSTADASLPRSGTAWRVAIDPGVAPAEVAALLARHGLRERGPLVAAGVHTVEALPGIAPALSALRADPRVRLVVPLANGAAAAPGDPAP